MDGTAGEAPDARVVKKGWLEKKGEYIKRWSKRFLVLYNDGTLNGYKKEPTIDQIESFSGDLENTFNIRSSHIIRLEQLYFKIRCRQQTDTNSFIERSFRASTEEDRNEWSDKIETICRQHQRVPSTETAMEYSLYGGGGGDQMAEDGFDQSINNLIPPALQRASRRLTIDSFEKIKVLGKGTFGQVFLVYRRNDEKKTRMALKTIPKSLIKEREETEHMRSEREVLCLIDHPFLIKLYHAFQNSTHLCFVMEFARGGEIYNHLSRCQQFSIPRCQLYGAEVVSAFSYLHSKNIIYRDLKLENLLLDEDGHIKITDFGLCKILHNEELSTRTFCGTPEYLAPEILDDEQYGLAVDWWSLGVVLHEMIVGKLPFQGQTQDELFDAITRNPLADIPQRVPEAAANILQQLLRKDPRTRLGAEPGDANAVKTHMFFAEIDWDRLERREITPQFVPTLRDDDDTSGFDRAFTQMPVHTGRTYQEQDEFNQEDNDFVNFTYDTTGRSHQESIMA